MNEKNIEELADEVLENEEIELEKEYDENSEFDEFVEETGESYNDEDILDLLDEDEEDHETEAEREELLNEEFNQEENLDLENFDIDRYLKDNYSFKEIDEIPFDEYKEEQLNNKDVLTIFKLYEKGYKLKGLDTFDDFLRFKKENIYVYIITFGLPFEYELFGMEPKLFVCKAFTSQDYINMIEENPDSEKDIDFFNDYIISNCVLYPELRMQDVGKLEYGISDVLLPAILKHSRFNSNYKIVRL